MWFERLGRIDMANHFIYLNASGARTTNSAPYCSGSKVHKFEKMETEKMVRVKVIDAAQSKWASSFLFAPKKDGSLRF